MRRTIIALSGRKNAGKNTVATFMTKHYAGTRPESTDELVLECSFADNLKQFCINTLGLTHEQCYGSDEEKNSSTEYQWEDASFFLSWKFGDNYAGKLVADGMSQDMLMHIFNKRLFITVDGHSMNYMKGYMTGREVMQIVGTDLMRQTFGNIWAKATVRAIKKAEKPLAIITDNRFPNEIEAVLNEPNGYIIRLTRSPFGTEDVHPSESALDDYDWNKERCFVLNNAEMNLEEQNEAVKPILDQIWNGEQ